MIKPKFFQLIWIVKFFDESDDRHHLKTISSRVTYYSRFEDTANTYTDRFNQQSLKVMSINALTSEFDFQVDWECIRKQKEIPWRTKTAYLLASRRDIEATNLFTEEGFKCQLLNGYRPNAEQAYEY